MTIRLLTIVVFACITIVGYSKQPNIKINANDIELLNKPLVLLHPTVNNLKIIRYLIDNELFIHGSEVSILGVYSSNAKTDYEESVQYIQQNKLKNTHLLAIDDTLNVEILYSENQCSKLFYQLFSTARGFIFMGGPDLPPSSYEHETQLLTLITDPHRHYLELSLLFHMIGGSQNKACTPFMEEQPDFPIFGICLGMQSMNVASGGTLIQDIPTQVYGLQTVEHVLESEPQTQHRNYYRNFAIEPHLSVYNSHSILIAENSVLDTANTFRTSFPNVLSSHHQCIKSLGMGFIPIAWSNDQKVIEGIQHQVYPNVIGVQFHPEQTMIYDSMQIIRISPFDSVPNSFRELFPDSTGVDFHKNLWKILSVRFN
ncbi:MAG: gamma-glutamyl-gamma-aminobutyrate hydrolase family protein [Salinivirgaceae bacterium]|nr:gamma-glutamyl-gamma-aminobutyrate hydrolase family protein [Salinivirgaceae bacterium]MDD4747783.1 gamma-glutamyl-gamma-aminobutyrate hydrolase family protein [Salinivirgaceae bacterium]MDY0280825.1 gamma-glutamyl-gamma-aminobutyrate hydrolase family protein [Salinivirgaceae bacterium]